MGTNNKYEQPPEELEAYFFFLVDFFFGAAFFLVAAFFLGAVFFLGATFLVEALAVAVFFLAAVFFFGAAFFLAAVFFFGAAFFLAGAAFFAGAFFKPFLASAESLYDALTLMRVPSATPLARAAFMTCFLISFCNSVKKGSGARDKACEILSMFEEDYKKSKLVLRHILLAAP